MKQSFDGLWAVGFVFLGRECAHEYVCVCMCVHSISTSYSTRWWFFAYIIGTIGTVSYFHLIMRGGHENRRVSWMDDRALCFKSCAHNCINAACLMMKVVPFSDRNLACEACRLILSYIEEFHVMLLCHCFLLNCPIFLVHLFQNLPLILFNPFYTGFLALLAVIDLDWHFKWILLRFNKRSSACACFHSQLTLHQKKYQAYLEPSSTLFLKQYMISLTCYAGNT